MVNRIWQGHFGRGLVATENDFGRRGKAPSHPELLDYLASRFVENGWSVKAMHRLIMTSRTYQMSRTIDPNATAADPENALLSHFARRRLDAEEIRDAMLFVAGRLDESPGGPHPFPPVATWGFTQHQPFAAVYDSRKRSVYLMVTRLKRHPYLALFDGADPNASTAHRTVSTVPTQALYFLNDPFVHEQAEALGRRILASSSDDRPRLDLACAMTLGRPPSAEDVEESLAFLDACRRESSTDSDLRAWSALARTLISRNEFLFVE